MRWPKLKYALLLLPLCLFAFVALESSPQEARLREIDDALNRREIGGLTAEETRRLHETLRMFAKSAGIPEDIRLNAPFTPGSFHIYTTTPAARSITNCGKGNAVYDAELDVIFIDTSVLRPFDSSMLGGQRENAPSNQIASTYAHFVILHEMGHRQLHRKSGGFFDSDAPMARNLEDEADDFALAQLFSIYHQYLLPSQVVRSGLYGGSSGLAWLNAEELMEDGFSNSRVAMDIVVTLLLMTQETILSDYAYSPFFSDEAHKTFIERSLRMLDSLTRAEGLDRAIIKRKAYVELFLKRAKSVSERKLVQAEIPGWIEHAAFVGNDLMILSSIGQLYQLSGQSDAAGQAAAENASLSIVQAERSPTQSIMFPWVRLPQHDSASTFGDISFGDLGSAATPKEVSFDGHFFSEVTEVSTPEYLAVVETLVSTDHMPSSTAADAYSYTVVDATKITWRGSYRSLETQYAALSGSSDSEISIDPLNWVGDSFFFLVSHVTNDVAEGRTPWMEIMQCRGRSFECDRIVKFVTPEMQPEELRTARKAVAFDQGAYSVFLVSILEEDEQKNWQLWKLTEGQPATIVARRKFLSEEINDILSDLPSADLVDNFFESETSGGVYDVVYLPPDRIFLNMVHDSCYSFKISDGSLREIFHPCGEHVRTSVAQNGQVAIFARNAHRMFIVDRQ